MRKEAGGVTTDLYPKTMTHHAVSMALSYHFEPGSPRDGATLTVPLISLNQVDANRCEWLVPGMLKEKVTLLIKSLPQKLRRSCVPLPDYAAAFCERHADVTSHSEPLVETLRDDIAAHTPARPSMSDFRLETLPAHLFMNFKLIDEHGRQVDMQRSLPKLRAEWGKEAQVSFQATAQAASLVEDDTYTDFSFQPLPELLEIKRKGQTLIGYPALVDTGHACKIDVFDEQEVAQQAHEAGLRRLFSIALKEQLKFMEKNLPDFQKCAMLYMPLGTSDELKAQWIGLTLQRSCLSHPLPSNKSEFDARVKDAKTRIGLISNEVGRISLNVLTEWTTTQKKWQATAKAFPQVAADIEQQLKWLLPKQFLLQRPWAQLAHYPRYLKAAFIRLDRVRNNPSMDAERMKDVQGLQGNWQKAQALLKGRTDPSLEEFGWQLQELRVSLFAQELKTPMPVSVKRLQKAWETLTKR